MCLCLCFTNIKIKTVSSVGGGHMTWKLVEKQVFINAALLPTDGSISADLSDRNRTQQNNSLHLPVGLVPVRKKKPVICLPLQSEDVYFTSIGDNNITNKIHRNCQVYFYRSESKPRVWNF